jgi:DNA-binding transcriptional MerR regulator
MTITADTRASDSSRKLHTIGAVCRRLKAEFPEISISKIRYLEDQGLLAPQRTAGGYRLFSQEDVERLETILRLQRDEFLPLRVIRQELTSPTPKARRRRPAATLGAEEPELSLEELCGRADVSGEFARELEAFGLIAAAGNGAARRYSETDADVAAVCSRLARYGIGARHLRTFRTTADREASLLQQLLIAALQSRNPERRRSALDDLQTLGELTQELKQLLFWRDLRQTAADD